MTQFLITFPAGAMDHIPEAELADVADAARAVCQQAMRERVLVMAGGLVHQQAIVVAPDGAVTDGAVPSVVSGVTIIDVATRDDALVWAARLAVACRCAQEVREIAPDPELDAMLGRDGAPRR